jgi:hypothetical protein
LVIKTLDPDLIRIGIQPKTLDPDPYQMNLVRTYLLFLFPGLPVLLVVARVVLVSVLSFYLIKKEGDLMILADPWYMDFFDSL